MRLRSSVLKWIIVFILGCSIFSCLQYYLNGFKASDLKVYSIDVRRNIPNNPISCDAILFTGDDIKEYNWEKQEIIFKSEFLKTRDYKYKPDSIDNLISGGSKLLKTKSTDRFVIFLKGKKIYDGCFPLPITSSFIPCEPAMHDIENGIRIDYYHFENGSTKDVRYNKKLYNFLKSQKLLIE